MTIKTRIKIERLANGTTRYRAQKRVFFIWCAIYHDQYYNQEKYAQQDIDVYLEMSAERRGCKVTSTTYRNYP